MLTATFVHAPGIGAGTEKKLWEAGILDWDGALSASTLPLSAGRQALLLPALEESRAALAWGDSRYFARALPAREHWRAAGAFSSRIAYLDIETNGGYDADDVTIIGLYDGCESRIFVKGQDLDDFPAAVADADLLVTFFGGGFDLPFLRRRFPALALDQLHVDLCPALRRLGYTGGLKAIEERLQVRRIPEVEGMTGWDAVRLWDLWERRRNADALRRLILYNRADIENLATLLDFALPRLQAATGFPG